MHMQYFPTHLGFVRRRDRHAGARNRLSPAWRVLYAQVFVRTVSESESLSRATGEKDYASAGWRCNVRVGTFLNIFPPLDIFISTLPISMLGMPISEPL
jgi:hypothetical protein